MAEVIDRLGLRSVVDESAYGLETVVGEGGAQLSGGQAQRLLMARLLYHRPKYILVDEGTSALDPQLETIVLQYLKQLAAGGSLVIMIAHRRASIDFSDEVIVMKKGVAVLSGRREDVISDEAFEDLFGLTSI